MEGMGSSLNERLERYAKINYKIENGTELYELESEFILNDADREEIISVLSSPSLYGKRLVKPVLAKIEEQMNDGSISINYGSLSIEHILPQTPTDDYWVNRFTIEDKNKWTNNLGNLSLISVRKNSQAKNFEFKRKVEVYFQADGQASNLAMVNKLLEVDNWSVEEIKTRNTTLLNHFLNAVGLEEIEILEPSQENEQM